MTSDPLSPLDSAKFCRRAYNEATWQTSGGAELLCIKDDGALHLGFRGTEGIKDVARDVRGYPWYSRELGIWCHRGFLIGAMNLINLAWGRISNEPTDTLIHLYGHSKGGGEAEPAAVKLCQQGRPPASITTFNKPRALFAGGCEILARNKVEARRYVVGWDHVSNMPWSLWGFRHYGEEIHLDGFNNPATDHVIATCIGALEG